MLNPAVQVKGLYWNRHSNHWYRHLVILVLVVFIKKQPVHNYYCNMATITDSGYTHKVLTWCFRRLWWRRSRACLLVCHTGRRTGRQWCGWSWPEGSGRRRGVERERADNKGPANLVGSEEGGENQTKITLVWLLVAARHWHGLLCPRWEPTTLPLSPIAT